MGVTMDIGDRWYVSDIDGCIADCDHRLPFILEQDPKDWEAFDAGIPDDLPLTDHIEMLSDLYWSSGSGNILLLTGRNVRTMEATTQWLHDHGVPCDRLEMRGLDDRRPASVMKLERLQQINLFPENVIAVFEDDPKTVVALRNAGYNVLQCGGSPTYTFEKYGEATTKGGR